MVIDIIHYIDNKKKLVQFLQRKVRIKRFTQRVRIFNLKHFTKIEGDDSISHIIKRGNKTIKPFKVTKPLQ